MKTHNFSSVFLAIVLFTCLNTSAQRAISTGGSGLYSGGSGMNGPSVAPRDLSAFGTIVNIHGEDGFYVRKNLYLTDSYTIIDGGRVLGTPFLYLPWVDGQLTTPDGRVYDTYKLRYNAYDQTVSFLNGTDSMEVNEDIKDFTLTVKIGDTTVSSTFVNSNQFKQGKTSYYEVLLDSDKGELLKENSKVVTNADDGILNTTKKYLNLVATYYYYDKVSKKLTKIGKAGNNIASMLKLSDDQKRQLSIDSYDFANEGDMMKFFKTYFAQGLKAF